MVFPERPRGVLTAADMLAFHAAHYPRVLLMDECGIGIALERKMGEGTLGRASDPYVVGFRHRWCVAGDRSISER